jgi:ABC-type transport system involved in cytochrome c biogenesis permease subunit
VTIVSTAAGIVLAVALVIQILFLFKTTEEKLSSFLLLLSAVLLVTVTILRSIQIHFVALTGTFESLIFYTALICILLFIYKKQRRIPQSKIISFISTIVAVIFLAIASSPLTGKDALLPVPALKSSWLLLHVSFAFTGEAFFVVSFAAALAGLFSKSEEKRRNYDKITYTAIVAGYPIFIAGALIFGAIWAQKAWGIWWSWDPKETWALITVLVYTFYLHARLIFRKSSRLISLIAVIGFLCTIFTLFGVNYLLPGLHSYK